jgi:hypothetical protein
MLSKAVGHQNADFNQSRDGQHHHPEERACHSQKCFSDRFHWRDYTIYLATGEAAANDRFCNAFVTAATRLTRIVKALGEAHKCGVDVQVVLDESRHGKKYGATEFTAHAGIPTWIDAKPATAHNKIMIIDGETLITARSISTNRSCSRNILPTPRATKYIRSGTPGVSCCEIIADRHKKSPAPNDAGL